MSAPSRTSRRDPTADPVERLLARHGATAAAALVVVLTVGLGVVQGPAMAILVLGAGAFVAAVALFWTSLRSLFRDRAMTPEEAYDFASPVGEDEHKRSVLRALNDLEFERSLGKISEEDFEVLRKRHRAEAQRLLQLQQGSDAQLQRRVEQLIEEHLDAAKRAGEDEDDLEDDDLEEDDLDDEDDLEEDDDLDDEDDGDDEPPNPCPHCQASNDADAVFCKKCGQRLDPTEAEEDER